MSEQTDAPQSNPPLKNFLMKSTIILSTTLVGFWGAVVVTDSLGTATTWTWTGIGLSVIYLLYDIANSVKELTYWS